MPRAPSLDGMTDPAPLFRAAAQRLAARDPTASDLLPQLEAYPDFATGWLAVAEVLLAAGQEAAARAALSRAARHSAPAAHRLGQMLAATGQRASAGALLAHAVALDPGHAGAWYSLGLLQQDAGDLGEAAAAFARALALRPGFHEAAFNLAVALQEDGRLEQALDAYAHALALSPDSFGRIAQALVSAPAGRLWLDPVRLRAELVGRAGGACGANTATVVT